MRDATDIQLDQLIVHLVNPLCSDGLVLSERILPLEEQQHLTDYFVTHIKNSLQDSAIKAAHFVSLIDGVVSGICKSMLNGEQDLVQGSQALARLLHEIIVKDRRISAGALAVCFYRAGNYPQIPQYLALLKIDPSEVFRHITAHDSQGNKYVSFKLEPDVLPTTREKLQKCAFVQPLESDHEYHMLLLDRQAQKQMAQFFTRDFLGAELTFDDRKRTDCLYKGLMTAQNQIRPCLKPQDNKKLDQAINCVVNSDSINIDYWLETLPLDDEYKRQIAKVVSARLPDREFKIDKTYAHKLTLKRRFRGDHNLRVEVPAEKFNQVVQSVLPIEKPGTPPYYQVVLHTEKWEEIP